MDRRAANGGLISVEAVGIVFVFVPSQHLELFFERLDSCFVFLLPKNEGASLNIGPYQLLLQYVDVFRLTGPFGCSGVQLLPKGLSGNS